MTVMKEMDILLGCSRILDVDSDLYTKQQSLYFYGLSWLWIIPCPEPVIPSTLCVDWDTFYFNCYWACFIVLGLWYNAPIHGSLYGFLWPYCEEYSSYSATCTTSKAQWHRSIYGPTQNKLYHNFLCWLQHCTLFLTSSLINVSLMIGNFNLHLYQ